MPVTFDDTIIIKALETVAGFPPGIAGMTSEEITLARQVAEHLTESKRALDLRRVLGLPLRIALENLFGWCDRKGPTHDSSIQALKHLLDVYKGADVDRDRRKPLQRTIHIGRAEDVDLMVIQLRYAIEDDWLKADEETRKETRPTYWIDFEIYEQVCADPATSEPGFYDRDGAFEVSHGITTNIDAAAPSVTGFVKWDGCTQFWFCDEPVHIDERIEMSKLMRALDAARRESLLIMLDEAHEYAPEPTPRDQAWMWFEAGAMHAVNPTGDLQSTFDRMWGKPAK